VEICTEAPTEATSAVVCQIEAPSEVSSVAVPLEAEVTSGAAEVISKVASNEEASVEAPTWAHAEVTETLSTTMTRRNERLEGTRHAKRKKQVVVEKRVSAFPPQIS